MDPIGSESPTKPPTLRNRSRPPVVDMILGRLVSSVPGVGVPDCSRWISGRVICSTNCAISQTVNAELDKSIGLGKHY
jgi:hypothetical protein